MTSRRPLQIAYSGEIDDRFLETLYQMPHRLVLSTDGGCVYTMAAAIDLLEGVGDLEIIGTGRIFSAGVPILASGKSRYCTRRTRFMVHEAAEDATGGRAGDLAHDLRELRKANRVYAEILGEKTKKSRAWWARLMERTRYFSAKEALEWGLVDKIL